MTTFIFQDSNDKSEIDRKKAEYERSESEKQRKINETERVNNETLRQNSENERVTAEEERKNYIENTVKVEVEKIEEFGSQVTKNTNQINNAKGEHDSLKARLDKDNEKVYEAINSKDFLPFEGENVTVEHSKVGFTKDMVVEGRTYQNMVGKPFSIAPTSIITTNGNTHNIVVPENVESVQYPAIRYNANLMKTNTVYTAIVDIVENDGNTVIRFGGGDGFEIVGELIIADEKKGYTGRKVFKFTTKTEVVTNPNRVNSTELPIWCVVDPSEVAKNIVIHDPFILEGDWTSKEIPSYFEGIKSVGDKEGKISILSNNLNIFNQEFEIGSVSYGYCPVGTNYEIMLQSSTTRVRLKDLQKVKPNKTYTLYITGVDCLYGYQCFDINKNSIGVESIKYPQKHDFTIPTNCEYINVYISKLNDVEFKANDIENLKCMLFEKNSSINEFVERKFNKKEILLTDCLRGVEGVYDSIENRNDGVYLVQRFRKKILDGTELMAISNGSPEYMVLSIMDMKPKQASLICDNLPVRKDGAPDMIGSGNDRQLVAGVMTCGNNNELRIRTGDLSTTVEGSMRWLQANPVTIYYELAKPIETKLDISTLNLETFKDVTHVFSENAIAPNLSFKAPCDVPATISTLRVRNENLEQENRELKEEVDIKTLKLHGQDVELTNSDLDLDFRIFELEMSLDIPMNLNMKGMRNMARSPYEMMKILILNNNYDREDIEYKAKRYLQGGRMTQAEYDEIISLMDANELVK